jgi:hypothetical protein
MKKLFSSLLTALLLILFSSAAYGQNYNLNDVGRFNVRNSGAIVAGNVVKGYYLFYQSEKVDKKNRAFEIVVLDEDLKEKVSERIIEPKSTYLLEASYNGSGILFKFYDSKSGMVNYRTVDNAGKLSAKESREANKYEIGLYDNTVAKDITNVNVNPFGPNKFVDVFAFKDNKGYSYQVEGLDNNGKSLWTYTPDHVKGVDAASFLTSNEDQVLLLASNAKNLLTRDYTFSLVSVGSDGNMKFEIPLANNDYNMLAHNAYFDGSKIVVIGEYYDIEDKSMKAESKGIFVKTISTSGEDITENFISWDKDIYNKVDAEYKKDIKTHYIFFHNIVKASDGKILAIGEQYRKQASAGGIAMKALAGSSSTVSLVEIKIGNMVVIELTSEYKLNAVNIIAKKPNRVNLDESYTYVNQHVLAKMMRAEGYFDYTYTQNSADNSLVTVGYIDMEKVEGMATKKAVFNTINYTAEDGKYNYDKLVLSTKASWMNVYPAKPGFVLITEYFKKEKKLSYRLEPINI